MHSMKHLLLAGAAIVLAACDSPSTPPDPTVAAVEISARTTTLLAGDTLHLAAAVTSSAGGPFGGATVAWSSSNTAVAEVGADGVLSARSAGTVRITAQAGGKSDDLDLTVTVPSIDRTPVPGFRHTCALDAQGRAYCWGRNDAGQVGVPVSAPVAAPTPVQTSLRFVALAAGRRSTCGIAMDGRLYCWGGLLAESAASPEPRLVGGSVTFQSISESSDFVCGVSRAKDVWCAGNGRSGQFGTGGVGSVSEIAVQVPGLKAISVTTGEAHVCAITPAGATLCWGANNVGQAGPPSPAMCSSGMLPCALTPQAVSGGQVFTQLAAGVFWTCGLTQAGAVYCWGRAPAISSATAGDPVLAAGGSTFTQITDAAMSACGIRAGGETQCWGTNRFGELGRGSFGYDPLVTPAPVSGPAFQAVAGGTSHSCGITAAGALYCWGLNDDGVLGATTPERCDQNASCSTTPRAVENWPPA